MGNMKKNDISQKIRLNKTADDKNQKENKNKNKNNNNKEEENENYIGYDYLESEIKNKKKEIKKDVIYLKYMNLSLDDKRKVENYDRRMKLMEKKKKVVVHKPRASFLYMLNAKNNMKGKQDQIPAHLLNLTNFLNQRKRWKVSEQAHSKVKSDFSSSQNSQTARINKTNSMMIIHNKTKSRANIKTESSLQKSQNDFPSFFITDNSKIPSGGLFTPKTSIKHYFHQPSTSSPNKFHDKTPSATFSCTKYNQTKYNDTKYSDNQKYRDTKYTDTKYTNTKYSSIDFYKTEILDNLNENKSKKKKPNTSRKTDWFKQKLPDLQVKFPKRKYQQVCTNLEYSAKIGQKNKMNFLSKMNQIEKSKNKIIAYHENKFYGNIKDTQKCLEDDSKKIAKFIKARGLTEVIDPISEQKVYIDSRKADLIYFAEAYNKMKDISFAKYAKQIFESYHILQAKADIYDEEAINKHKFKRVLKNLEGCDLNDDEAISYQPSEIESLKNQIMMEKRLFHKKYEGYVKKHEKFNRDNTQK